MSKQTVEFTGKHPYTGEKVFFELTNAQAIDICDEAWPDEWIDVTIDSTTSSIELSRFHTSYVRAGIGQGKFWKVA